MKAARLRLSIAVGGHGTRERARGVAAVVGSNSGEWRGGGVLSGARGKAKARWQSLGRAGIETPKKLLSKSRAAAFSWPGYT